MEPTTSELHDVLAHRMAGLFGLDLLDWATAQPHDAPLAIIMKAPLSLQSDVVMEALAHSDRKRAARIAGLDYHDGDLRDLQMQVSVAITPLVQRTFLIVMQEVERALGAGPRVCAEYRQSCLDSLLAQLAVN